MKRKDRVTLLRERWAVVGLKKDHKPASPATGLFRNPFVEPRAKKWKPRPKRAERPLPWTSSVHGVCLHEAHRRKLWVMREDEERTQPWMPRPKRRRGEPALSRMARKLKRGTFAWRD